MTATARGVVAPTHDHAISAATPGSWHTDAMLLAMALIWGINFSVVKFGTRWMQPLAYNGARVALAAVCLLAIAAAMRHPWPAWRDLRALLLLGVLGNGIYQIFFIEGIARTRAGTAALVLASGPAFIALISRMRGVEHTTARGWAAIALQIAGMAFVVLGSARADAQETRLLGTLLVLAGSLCWATFTVVLKPYTHRVPGLQLAAVTMAGGALPLLIVAVPALRTTDWSAVPPLAWASVVYSGIGALVVAYLLWYRGVRVLGPTRTAMYVNVQPLIALVVAWVTLGETPTLWQGVGAVGITAGLLMNRP